MKMNERMKKVFSILLCLCMLLQNAPVMAFAATTDNLCEHHTEHTAECHYAEAIEGQPCTHVHDELCGYIEAVAEVKCACEATDENGALVHTEGCGYVAPVTGADCAHVHDEACGYVAAVEAHECHYECAECANSDVIANQSADWCGNPLCSQEDAFHVTSCTQYVAPENPQCFCVEKCTEPNVWCDVCGFDYTACTGTDTAVTWDSVDLSCNTSSFGNNRGTWYLNPDNAATEFYNLIDDKLIGGYSYVPERTYITTNAYDYRDNLGNDGYLWTDCKNQTIQDGRYYIYVFTRSASQFNRIEYIVDVQLRYTVNISVTGAPSGYGGVTLNGSNAGSPQYLKKGGSMTLTVKDVPSHKHTVTYDSSVTCSQNGDTYAFSNVNRSFTFKVVYEADEFATVSFGQPEGATISVNGNSTSPVRVIAGMPYTVSVKTNDGYYLTGITVDGTTTSLDTTSYNRNLTAGANGAGHTISVTTAKVAIPVNTTASITYTKNQDKASLVNAIKNAVYAGSGSNVNSLTVNYLYFGDFYNPIDDYTDIWESVLTAGEMFSCNVKESVSIKLSSGDVYSQACTLYLYDGDISAKGEIKKDYTEEPVKLDGNDFNCAYPANFSSSYPVEYRYYTQSGQRLSSAPTEVGKYQVQVKASSDYKANPDAIIGTSWTSWSGLIPFEIVSVPAYSITVENSSGGRVTASKETSIAGKTVTLTIEPDVGYLVDTVSYNGTAITPVEGVYSFTMPAGAVTVSATFKACEHTGGEATCTEQAVCTVCGESYGEPLGHSTTAENDIPATCKNKAYCSVCDSEYGELGDHSYNTTGYCTACGEQAVAKIGDTFYLTFAEAAAKVTEGETIEVLTDVTIAEDETVAFAAFATLDVPEGKNITCNGTVKIGEEDGIIFENALYYDGGDITNDGLNLNSAVGRTYYKAGEGYILYDGSGKLELHDATLWGPTYYSSTTESVAIESAFDLTIAFYGTNSVSGGKTQSASSGIDCDGSLTLTGMGGSPVLNISSGEGLVGDNHAVQSTAVTITAGTVNASSTDVQSENTCGVSAETITVESGAVLNATAGKASRVSAGIIGSVVNRGEINAVVISAGTTGFDYAAMGNAVLIADQDLSSMTELGMTATFRVPAGTSLTVNEGVTVDLSKLAVADIDFTGTVINNGTILLPAGFNIEDAPKGGNVKIGEKSHTWNGEKWICGEGSHLFDEITHICSVCGEVETFNVTVSASDNGSVTAKEYAIAGEIVTLNVSPAEGYMLDMLTVADANGDSVTVDNNAFTMPASAVTVSATFKALPPTIEAKYKTQTTQHLIEWTARIPAGLDRTLKSVTVNGYELLDEQNATTKNASVEIRYGGKYTFVVTDSEGDTASFELDVVIPVTFPADSITVLNNWSTNSRYHRGEAIIDISMLSGGTYDPDKTTENGAALAPIDYVGGYGYFQMVIDPESFDIEEEIIPWIRDIMWRDVTQSTVGALKTANHIIVIQSLFDETNPDLIAWQFITVEDGPIRITSISGDTLGSANPNGRIIASFADGHTGEYEVAALMGDSLSAADFKNSEVKWQAAGDDGTITLEGLTKGTYQIAVRAKYDEPNAYNSTNDNGWHGLVISDPIVVENTYTITYDLNGGVGTAPDADTKYVDTAFTVASDDGFSKTGHTFLGWALRADAAAAEYTEGASVSAITTDTKLYAVWKVNPYTITFDTDGGTEIAPITQNYGTTVTAPVAPTKTGYTFTGWDVEFPANMPAENLSITAQWAINQYTITFDPANGEEKITITQDYGTPITAPELTYDGYHFLKWDTEVPATMPEIRDESGLTITAIWEAHSSTGDNVATCLKKAKCDTCGDEYGEKDTTNHVSDVYTYTDNGDGTHTKTHECGAAVGEPENHTFDETGKCVCTAQAQAKIGDTFYLTLAEAAAKVAEGETIEVLTDVTIAEDETVAFAAFATLDVPEGKNITCSGTVKIGEKDGIIFENQLYYLGALCADSSIGIELVNADPYTYYPAGDDGYAIYEGNGILRLHNAVITTPDAVSTNSAYCIRSNDTGNLTIYFSGKNTLTSGNAEDSNASIYVEGDLTLIAEGENAELTVRSGNSSGNTPGISANSLEVQGGTVTATGGNSSGSTSYGIYVDTDLTISSGIVNAHGGSGMMSLGVGASTITVADGAALYTTGGEATFASAGIQAATISGNVNALRVSINETELAIDYTVYGDLVLTKDLTIFDPFAGVEVAEEYAFTITFTVPEGTSLTVNEGVTLDLSDLTMDDIDFTGTVINNGTILLPAGFNIANAPKSGNVKIGEKSYTWDSADNKWICGEGSHIFDEITRICSVCGEVETFTVTWRDGYDADSETWAYEQTTEVAYGETITPPDYEAEKTGYTFGGWRFWLDEYNEEEFTGTVMPAQNLYAQPQYTPIEYKITWILNGCKVDPRFESELPETLPYNGDEDPGTISIHLVAPEGYRIAGYKDGNGNALRYSEGNGYLTVPVTGETTVEVVVEPLPFTLTVWAIDFAEGNEAPTSGRVELTVPYGEKLIDYIEQYKAGSSDEDKPIYMLNETVTVNGKEYEGTFTVSQWLEDISYTEIDIQTATMPAKDYSIIQDYSFTGWVYDYYNEEGDIVAECLGTCYWAGNEYLEGWQLIDGSLYCFVYNEKQMEYYRAEGLAQVPMQNSEETALHLFTEDGKWRDTFTGLYTDTDGKKYHVENGIVVEKHEYTYKNNGTTHTGTCACGDSFTGEHTLTYTVEGNMLTAACSVCKEANVGSVSVTVQDKTYDGAPMEAKVTVVGLPESAEYTVTYTGTTRGGTVYNSAAAPQDAGDYTATLEIGGVKAETQFTIEPKEITFTFKFFGPAAKTYDGTVDVGIMKVNPSGLIEGDSISCTCDMTARFEDPNVGENKTLTISGCKLGGEDAANYWVESTYTATMSIVPRTVTITGATIEDVLYDENGGYDLEVSSTTFSGIVNGEALTQGVDYTLSAALTGENKPGTAAVQVTVTLLNGNYSLSNTTVDTTVNLLVHVHEWDFTADPMNPNRIIVNCLGEIGECSIPFASFSIELRVPNTVYNGLPKDALVIFGEPDTGIKADVTYSAEDRINVTGQPITATLKLGSAEVAVTYTVVKAVIGEAPFSVTAPEANGEPQSAVSGGEYHSAEIRWNTDAEVFGFNTAYTAVVTLTADGNHKFASDLAQEGWTANVSADGSTAAFTKTFPATRKAKLTALTDAPAEQKLAAYHIDADGAIGELPATVTYTSESGDVTVDIQWSCADYNAATKAQNTFAWSVKSGELDNYDANGKAISGTVTVTNLDPIPVTNIGTDKTVTYDGSDIDLRTLFTLDQNAGEADYTIIDLSGEGTSTGAPYLYRVEKAGTFTVKVTTAAKDPYAKGEAVATLTVNKAAGEGSVTIEGWTYGEEANAPMADGTGAVTFHYSTEDGKAPTDAGTYTVTATFAATDLYEETTATADFTVNKAKLTVTAEDNTITYGDAPAANGAAISGFVGAESVADLSGELTFTYTYEQFGSVGTYKITPSGLTSGNYEITFVDGTLTVNAKPITVTADEVTKTYGEADPTLTYKVEGLVNGDQLTGELKRAEGEDVGSYAIGQNTLTAGDNYTITYTGANLTINAKAITDADVELNGSLTYTGSEQTQQITVTEGIVYEVTGNKATEAGDYTLTVTASGNYTGSVTKQWSIGKAEPEIVWNTGYTNSYGKNMYITAYVNGVDGKLLPGTAVAAVYDAEGNERNAVTCTKTDSTGTYFYNWLNKLPDDTYLTVGSYVVKLTYQGDENYNDKTVELVTYTISKADPVIGTVGCDMALFNSTAISNVELTRTDMSVDGTLVLTDSELTAGEGTYNWKFTPKDTNNYNTITGTVVLNVTADVLEKIEASGTLEKDSYSYGDTFSIDGLTVTATYTSGATKDVTGLVSFDSTLAVGQTAVELTYQGKTCIIDGITVSRKQLDVSGMAWDVPKDAVYSGTAYTATLTGDLPEGVTVIKTGDTATNAGGYTAKAVFSLAEGYSTDNYEIVNGEDLTADWSIAKKNIADAEITLGTALTYNGEQQTQTVASVKIDGLTVTYMVSGNTGTDAKGYTLTVTGNGNFEGTATADWSIAKKNISGATIALGDSLTYNGSAQTQTVTEVKIGDLTVTYNVTDNKQLGAGNYTLTVTGNGNFEGSATADWSIAKAKLTITANNNSITYGDVPAANGVTGTGFVSSESIEDLSGELTFTYTYEQFGNVGTYKIIPSGLTSGNYEITFADGTLTVNAKAITVTADALSKTYGEADPTLTYKVEGLVNGDQLTGELKRAEGEDVGTYAIGQNTLTAGNNYTISYTGAELTVTKRSVTVTAKDQTVIYGETISGTEFTAAGLLEGHSAAVTLTPSTAKVTVNGIITPSAAVITADGKDVTANYEISYADGKLEIHPDTSRLDDLTTENVTSDDAADIQAVQDMLDNAESTREEWEEISDLCNDLTEKIEETAKENDRIAEEASKFDLDNVQSSDEETVSDLISDIDEQLATDNLTDEERNELEGLKTKCEDLIAKIDGTEELMDQLEKEVEDRDEDTVKSTDKAALEQVIEDADSLIGSGNVTEAEKEALEKVKEEAEKLIDVIDDTASAKKEATDAAESFDEETVKSTDQEALEKAKEAIEDLLDTDNLTEDERSALEEVLEQVDGMIEILEDTASGSKDAADAVENLKPETVTSESKDELTEAIETIEELLKTDHLTEDERKVLEETKAEAEKLIDAIEAAQDATDTDNTQKVENVTSENVKPEDKEALEDAREDLEKALEDNAGNYTEEEKQAIQDEIQRIESAVEALEKVEDVTKTVAKLPDTVNPDDEDAAKDILAAKDAYDALTDHEKSLVDEDTAQKLEGLVAALTAYKIVKGDGSKWMQNKDGDLSFTANGAFSKFVGIEVDGKHVDEKYYDAKSGSTVITLKQSFLKKLSAGEHTLTVIYTDGKTSGTFFVQEEAMSPATGDSSNIVFWTSTMFVSMAALMVLLAESKKRRTVK